MMFKTLHMVVTIIRTNQVANILIRDYNINIKNANAMGPTELAFNLIMTRNLSNKQVAQEVYETIQINNIFVGNEAA